jgi:ribosomal protein S18 acetylase RimI-like enzyme
MFIARATTLTDELLNALHLLIPQLKADFPLPTQKELASLLSAESSQVFIARHPDEKAPITGILTLIIYRVPTGIRSRIEDVVVDVSNRGEGIGEALIRHALRVTQESGADGVALTSNPKRKAANTLYQKIGFNRWETNLYFYKF